jgi:hypothetical protein
MAEEEKADEGTEMADPSALSPLPSAIYHLQFSALCHLTARDFG